jgi:hypothetical protein
LGLATWGICDLVEATSQSCVVKQGEDKHAAAASSRLEEREVPEERDLD